MSGLLKTPGIRRACICGVSEILHRLLFSGIYKVKSVLDQFDFFL